MDDVSTFTGFEVSAAFGFAVLVEAALFALVVAVQNTAFIQAKEEAPEKEVPIAVKPVLDDLPLLKLGGKRVRAKLPDMWMKKPPIKRWEAASAPSPMADKNLEELPKTPLASRDAEAPPPDAELAKKADDIPQSDASLKPVNTDEEGAQDGIKEGTETDPLKAYAVSQYRARIIAWFNSRFKVPELPCEELKALGAGVAARVSGERTVAGYTITRPSGNAVFDARVKQTMDSIVAGRHELPPPPPKYPDILDSTVSLGFSGRGQKCE